MAIAEVRSSSHFPGTLLLTSLAHSITHRSGYRATPPRSLKRLPMIPKQDFNRNRLHQVRHATTCSNTSISFRDRNLLLFAVTFAPPHPTKISRPSSPGLRHSPRARRRYEVSLMYIGSSLQESEPDVHKIAHPLQRRQGPRIRLVTRRELIWGVQKQNQRVGTSRADNVFNSMG